MQANSLWIRLFAFILVSLACAKFTVAQPPAPPEELLQDAALCDVFFLDPDVGWAVGEHGLILKTIDGGRDWQRQFTPVHCRLESVFFTDAQNGWAVGGYSHAYTHRSTGVVLRTSDGGRRWEALDGLLLPALDYVKFLDRQRGWATGGGSSLHPTGVFRTSDGGRSWTAVGRGDNLHQSAGWIAADFVAMDRGAVASFNGHTAVVTGGRLQPAANSWFGPRPLNCLQLQDNNGWLVGEGGLALLTTDGGQRWRDPAAPLPAIAAQMDLRAVAMWGSHCWLAGAPGSCLLHSADGGASWEVLRTGQSLPLADMTFIDEHRGWVVGALGTVLATRDGGRTWSKQRSGGDRAALLAIFGRAEHVPWELLASESGEDGHLSAVEIVCRAGSQPQTAAESSPLQRAREAVSAVGGSSLDQCWRLPARDDALRMPAASILQDWRETGAGPEWLEELMVRRIRQWRPDVVVTENASPRGERPLAHMINQIALRAAAKAGDETQYPEQINSLGLAPWSPKKLLGVLPEEERGSFNINTAQLAPRLGCTLADKAARSRGLIAREQSSPPANVGLRLLVDQLPQEAGQKGVFSGIVVREGEAKRSLGRTSQRNLRELTRIAGKRRTIDELLKRGAADSQSGFAWLAQVDNLTSGLNAQSAADVLYHLGRAYERAGQPELTAEAFNLLVERYPDSSLCEPSLVWMVQYYASAEAAWRYQHATNIVSGGMNVAAAQVFEQPAAFAGGGRGLAQFATYPEQNVPVPLGRGQPVFGQEQDSHVPFSVGGGQTALAGFQQSAPATNFGGIDRTKRTMELASLIERTRPALFADPRIRFPLAAAQRDSAQPLEVDPYYQQLINLGGSDAWRDCAVGEIWIAQRRGQPPKTICRCQPTSTKPRLDGDLDEPLWQSAMPLELKSPRYDDYQWPAVVMAAYDEEFLYLAASCRQPAGGERQPAGGEFQRGAAPRPRDPEQHQFDRIAWLIDIDRDYATCYELTVDERGWVGDVCQGDSSWNPQWFVASGGDAEHWTVEAAIPLAELAPHAPKKGVVWSLGAQRIAPHVGFQSWTGPASPEVLPQGFGWLVFE